MFDKAATQVIAVVVEVGAVFGHQTGVPVTGWACR